MRKQVTTTRLQLYAKMLIFSFFYGFVLINWVDLFGSSMPAYHIWLILMYFIPALVIIVIEGTNDLAISIGFGLFTSLMNDIFYFVAGNLLFGFHQNLINFWMGQFGFDGWKILFYFNGGIIHFPVYSWLMGLSIYTRIISIIILSELWFRTKYL